MLVQSLTARVRVSGGYILTQKVDQMSGRDRPLLDVLSAFDDLCVLIRNETAPSALARLSNRLVREFENDLGVLARLVPNVRVLAPRTMGGGGGGGGAYNDGTMVPPVSTQQPLASHNVQYMLRRFIRIVSSRANPVVIFLDDLQVRGRELRTEE